MSLYLNKMLNTLEKDKKKGREALSSNANLRQGADTYKQGMMDVLQRDAPKIQTRNDTLDLNPYTTPALNMRFQQTYSTLDNARKKYGANVDPYEDALRLTDRYGDTVRKSYDLFGGNKAKDYISIADKDQQKQLQETLWGYQYQNSTPEQLRGRLEELQYQSPSQITARNQQNVINLAKEKGAGRLTPEEEKEARMYEEAARYTGTGNLVNGLKGVSYAPLTGTGMETEAGKNPFVANADTREQYRQKAQDIRKKSELTFEQADKYLQNDAGYAFAAGHQGDLTPYIQAASDMTNVIAKAAKSGWGSLTEPEKESARQVLSRVNVGGMGYDSLAWDEMSDSQVTKALGSLTGARGAAVDKLGKQWAEELKRNNGIYSKYDETAEQAYVLGKYRDTLEGAKRYYEEAQGTEDEERARANLYFVENRTNAEEIAADPDFKTKSLARADFTSGDAGLDRYYRIINNIDDALAKADMHVSMSGGRDEALDFALNLGEKDKGVFNTLLHDGKNKEAQQFLDYMRYGVNKKIRENAETAMYNLAHDSVPGSIAAGLMSIPMEMARPIGMVDTAFQNARNLGNDALGLIAKAGFSNIFNLWGQENYRPVDMNTGFQMPGALSEAADKGITEAYDWNVRLFDRDYDVFDTLYSTLKSGTVSYATGALTRGMGLSTKTAEKVAGLWLAGSAGQGTMQDIAKSGGNNTQIMLGGILASAFEYGGEKWSIGELFKDMDRLGYRTFSDRLRNMGKEALVNFAEEFNTETANIVMNYILMGDLGTAKKNYDEYKRLGMGDTEAQSEVWRDLVDQAIEAGLSGALMGAGFGEIANVSANRQTAKVDKASGAALKPETRVNLAHLAGEFSGTKALADKYDPAKATNRQTGELLRETLNQLTGQDRRRLIDALAVDFQEAGIQEQNSQAIVQMMAGEELSPEQIQGLARDEKAMDALYEALGVKEKEEKPAGSGPKFGSMRLGDNNRLEAMDAEGLNIAPMPGTRPAEESRPERPALHPESEAVSLGGEAVPARQNAQEETARQKKPAIVQPMAFEAVAQDGAEGNQERKTVRVTGISRDRSSGAVEVTLEDGQRVALEDAGISREAQDLAAEAADLPQDAQNAMVANHRKGQDTKAYARGFKAIFNMAAIGQDGRTVRSLYGDDLTQEQRDAAIEAGKAEYERTRVQRAARTMQAAQELKRRGFAFRTLDEGQTDRGGVYLAQVEKPMSDGAAAQLRVINDLAEDYGVQVRVYDHLDANGFYQGGTNIINVALDAEEEMLGRTTSHELFHFVKEWNRDAGQRIQDFVLDTLRNTKGYDLEARINEVSKKGGQNLDPEAAKEDIAAESILDVLANEKNISALYKEVNSEAVKAKNPGLWEQITNWIKDTVAKLRAGMERIAWSHPEVRAMKDQTDKLAQIAEWMDQAARQAGENYRAAQEKLYPSAANDADVKEYLKAMGQAVTLEDAAAEADGLASRLFTRAEEEWIGEHQDQYEQGFDAFRQALDEYTQGKKTLPMAFEDAGLDVPKETLFPVLAYAGRQWSSARRQMEQGNKFQMRADSDEREKQTDTPQFKRWFGKSVVKDAEDKPIVVYHGTGSDFSEFDLSMSGGNYGETSEGLFFFTSKKDGYPDSAADYAREAGKKTGREIVMPVYLRIEKPLRLNSRGYYSTTAYFDQNAETIYDQFFNGKYDGIIIENSNKSADDAVLYIIDNKYQVKSATDNIGTFDGDNPDIRYSQRADNDERQDDKTLKSLEGDPDFYTQAMSDEETADAVRMFARIYRELEHTKGELVGNVTGREDWKKRRTEIAQRLIAETGSKMKLNDVANWVGRLFNALDQGGYDVGEALIYARELGMALVREAPGMEIPMDDATKEARRIIKSRAFYLTDDQKSEAAASYGTLGAYMRKNYGRMKIRKKGTATPSLAEVWAEDLTPLNPGVFSPDATEADMVTILDAWLDNSGERKYSADFGANAGNYATSIGLELMGEYLDMPWTNTRVNRLSDTYNKSLKKLRDNYQGKYEKQVEKARERREAREEKDKILNEIKRAVRPVRTRIMNATDSRHIPEDLRGAAEAFLHIFDRDRAIFSGYEIQELAHKYRLMAENGALHDSVAAARYDEDIDSMLQWLGQKMGAGRSLREMTTDELKMISNIAQHITSIFTSANQIEVDGRQLELDREAEGFMAEMRDREETKLGPVQTAARALAYKEMTPVYFGKRVGGIVQQCINDLILNGQPKYAVHAKEAREFFEETAKKYHINNWINSKDHLKIETIQGDQLELTKEQAMTLYAWWKREQTNTLQNGAHLRLGGFTYDLKDKDVRKLQGVDLHKSHVLSSVEMDEIEKYLGSEAVGFVTDMVEYLSNTVSEWGNEASMALFGWKKYGEKYYFPYPTDSQYRGKNLAFGSKGQNRKLKNISASHALLENAHNPLKLGNFTRIWAEHVDEMAMYNAFAQKLDNLERVTNYVVDGETQQEGEEEGGKLKITSPESAKKLMEKAMGTEAVQYLEQFINDINGGVRGDERGFSARMLSLFKKGSVAANLSVMLQQPSAFVRAMSMVSPRYFVKGLNPKDLKGVKARMYENSGSAIIKDMGRFDTNVGQSSVEWMLDAVNNPSRLGAAYDFMDEWTGKGAELADELTWCWMYSAVENEVEATTGLKPGTKEFNEAAGKRFDAVMTQTQVYDSTLAKSPWMRSTGGLDKMVTSFMSEPTLWFNMLMDAAADVKEKKQGAGRKAAAAAGVFIGGTFVNALLKSLATAMRRKDDEGRTWLEKYLAEVTGNFVEDISPFGILNMVPLARDLVSIVQGYDVERADMSQVSDLWNKIEKLMKKGGDASATEWIDAGAAAANIFGIPARNVIRDMKGLWGAFFGGANANEPNTGRDIWLSILDNVGETIRIGPYSVWDNSRSAYYNRMEQALLNGDMEKYNELRGYMEETNQVKPDAVTQGIKAELKASVQGGLISDDRALEVLTGSLGMEQDKAWALVDKWVQERAHKGEEEYSYQKYSTLWGLMDAGKDLAAEKKRLAGGGVTEKAFDSAVKQHIGDQYKEGAITEKQAESLIKKYMGETDAEKIHWIIDEWAYKRDNGSEASYSRYVDVFDAVKNGKSLTAPMKEMTANGYEEKDVRSEIRSQIGKWYKGGELSRAQTESKLKQYAGITDANDLYWTMDQLDYEKANAKNKSAAAYAKYASYYKAVETGNNLTQETNRYLSHGVKKETMASQITSNFKPQYTALVNAGRKAEADKMMERLLRAYEVLGYERSKKRKDIEKWLK